MATILAVYEGGVLRPTVPLDLTEGQTVQLQVYPRLPPFKMRPPTPEEEDYARRLDACKTPEEMLAVMDTAPQEPEFDIVEAINETRRLSGFRMPDPKPENEAAR
ncbi:antitoxin family protein [Zavarzinella formosa]|uniref:antitoxin family protein n=1 Tax=Zavarzinella formosa TaxID=360055 RepID=UPI001930DA5C|nr:antitoxin family protein [Zavarzinella formosa]